MAGAAGVDYVSEQAAMQFDAGRDVMRCDAVFWSDGDHWSAEGERVFGRRIAPTILGRLNASGEN
jgi:hypothetical protein